MTSTFEGSRPVNIIRGHAEALKELAETLDGRDKGRLLSVCSMLDAVATIIHAGEVINAGTNQAVVLRFDRG